MVFSSFVNVLVLLLAAEALGQSDVAVFEAPHPEAVERGKMALDKWNAQAATERGLINTLLGNSCFTTAMAALNRECSQLSNEQRCWLAVQFTMCFQRASGFKVLDCPTVCPKRRSLHSCVEECTGRMDDRQSMTYTQFFGDVLNMCFFLQTQNFQQVTAALVNDMHASSAAANASLAALQADIQGQQKAMAQSMVTLTKLQATQQAVEAAVQAGLSEVQAVSRMTQGLEGSMEQSLNMTSTLSSRHEQLMQGFTELDQAHQQHAARAHEALDKLAQEAAALEQRQARYESLQSRLLNASESLLDQSQGMSELLQVLTHYQAKGNTILTQLQGSSISLHDVLFYTVALSIPLVFITYPSDMRLLLLAGVLTCWGVERAVLQHYVMLVAPWQNAGQEAGTSVLLGVQDVKVVVRVVVLGGALGVVVWLLLKRRAAHNRREAIFQAIQQSLQASYCNQAAANSCAQAHPHSGGLTTAAAATHMQHLVPVTPAQQQPSSRVQPTARQQGRAAGHKKVGPSSPPPPTTDTAVALQQLLLQQSLQQSGLAGGQQENTAPLQLLHPMQHYQPLPASVATAAAQNSSMVLLNRAAGAGLALAQSLLPSQQEQQLLLQHQQQLVQQQALGASRAVEAAHSHGDNGATSGTGDMETEATGAAEGSAEASESAQCQQQPGAVTVKAQERKTGAASRSTRTAAGKKRSAAAAGTSGGAAADARCLSEGGEDDVGKKRGRPRQRAK